MTPMTLPPLPDADYSRNGEFALWMIPCYTADQMREYAQAAVLAERAECALVCDVMAQHYYGEEGGVVADRCAFDIRARVE